jgi:hypothetical protein
MFERFTESARGIVSQAQANARQLGHSYIGCEHLLMAAAMVDGPAGAALRDHDITPERIEATLLSTIGPLSGLDKEALASIGIDLDAVRAKVEAEFGPDALTRALPAAGQSRRPAWGKGPLAELKRRRRRRRTGWSSEWQRPVFARAGSPRPHPVHAARQEDPGTLAAGSGRAARQQHRRRAHHPRSAHPEGRHGTPDSGGPRGRARIGARRDPRPLPQGELTGCLEPAGSFLR